MQRIGVFFSRIQLGTIDWSEVMAALGEIRYAGDFTYETHNSIRVLPDELRDSALAYAAETAKYLIRRSHEAGGGR